MYGKSCVLLLDVLAKQPERQLNAVANELREILALFKEKSRFFSEVAEIFELCADAKSELIPVYAKLFEKLIDVSIVLPNHQISTVRHALDSYLTRPFALSEKSFKTFRRQIPLMSEICQLRLVPWSILKTPLKALTGDDSISIKYLFEVVRLVSSFIDFGINNGPSTSSINEDPYWSHHVTRLKEAYDNNVLRDDRKIEGEMYDFFSELKKKHRWYCPSKNSSRSRKSTESSTTDSEPSKRPRTTSPGLDLARGKEKAHERVEQSQTGSVRKIMATLVTSSPDHLPKATSDIKAVLRSRTNFESFGDDVFEILNATFAAQSQAQAFEICVKLLNNLRSFELKPPALNGEMVTISFREAVSRCVIIQNRFQTKDEIGRFCASFCLTNELFKIGLVPENLFEIYATRLADGDDEISLIVLFKLIANFYKLVVVGAVKFANNDENDERLAFWQSRTNYLLAALHRGNMFDKAMSSEISNFLKYFETNGGWRLEPKSLPVEVSSVIAFVEETAQVASLIDLITLTGDSNAWLLPFISKLKLPCSPFEFSQTIELVMSKVFEQIVDEKTLAEAGNACSTLHSTNFGRGKNFSIEFENFSLKYLSGKQAHDLEHEKLRVTKKDDLKILESAFNKSRLGCIRLICELYLRKVLNLPYLTKLCDSLFSTKSEEAFDCLSELFAKIGKEMAMNVLENNCEPWWTSFFEELEIFSKDSSSPATLTKPQKLAISILLEKSHWPETDWKWKARGVLKELVEGLTPELRLNSPDQYDLAMEGVRDVLVKECPGNLHVHDIFDLFLGKIDQRLGENQPLNDPVHTPAPS